MENKTRTGAAYRREQGSMGIKRFFIPWKTMFVLTFFAMAVMEMLQGSALKVKAAEDKVTFDSYNIYTYRDASMGAPPNGAESMLGCHIVIEAAFEETLTLTDEEKAGDFFQLAGSTSVGLTGDVDVSVEDNLLILDFGATYMPGGIIQFAEGTISGLQCGESDVYWPGSFRTVVPTGLTFHVQQVTVGTETTPASTTVEIDSSAVIRSMNHILWTSNGSSILEGTGTAQTTAAHHHNYWSFTLGTSAEYIQASTGALTASGYSVSYENDTVTITAQKAKEGEYLGIYNYDDNFLQEYGFALEDAVKGLTIQEPAGSLNLEKRCQITLADTMNWTGEPLEPEVTVTDGYRNGVYGYVLEEGVDYQVTYSNNVDWPSTALVTIDGLGDYAGSQVIKTFRITKALDESMFLVDTSDETFTGSAFFKEVVSVKDMEKGKDYSVQYYNNAYAGVSSVVITGEGSYGGTLTYTYTIYPAVMEEDRFVVDTDRQTYTGAEIKPSVTSETLQKGMDYKVTYSNNINPGTAVITITGNGNYTGTLTWNFTIVSSGTSNPGVSGSKNGSSSTGAAGTVNNDSSVNTAMKKAVIKKITAKKKKLRVKWSSVGAKKYKVYYRVKGTSKWKTKTVKTTAVTLTSLKKGKKYQIKIQSVNGSNKTVSKIVVSPKVK